MQVGTGFRGGDLLSLRIKQVKRMKSGEVFRLQESKTSKKRLMELNDLGADALAALIAERVAAGAGDDDWVFVSQSNMTSNAGRPLTNVSLTRLWKHWCASAGLQGQFGAHTGRKSLGYLTRVEDGVGIEVIQKLYGHSSPRVTQAYICVMDDEVQAIVRKNRTNRDTY